MNGPVCFENFSRYEVYKVTEQYSNVSIFKDYEFIPNVLAIILSAVM